MAFCTKVADPLVRVTEEAPAAMAVLVTISACVPPERLSVPPLKLKIPVASANLEVSLL